jgi:predicted TIM-barrel fold metal-dependent hydrolase
MELVYESGVPDFRGHWDRMLPWLDVTHPRRSTGDWESPYLTLKGRRTWPPALTGGGGEPALDELAGLAPGVVQDNARGRLDAMDAAGADVHLINAAPSVAAARMLPSNLAAGVFGAYNRYAVKYCDADPARLKTTLMLHGLEPQWSAEEIRELAQEPCVGAVSVFLPVKIAPEKSAFAPIWDALEETGLPLLHRSSFSTPAWTPRYLLGYLTFAALLERYPGVRIAFAEFGVSWAPGAIEHVETVTDSPGRIRDHVEQGRLFAVAGPGDDDAAIERATAELGPNAVLWESYFPFAVAGAGHAAGDRRNARLEANGDALLRGRDRDGRVGTIETTGWRRRRA